MCTLMLFYFVASEVLWRKNIYLYLELYNVYTWVLKTVATLTTFDSVFEVANKFASYS